MLGCVVGIALVERLVLLWKKIIPVRVVFTNEPFDLHGRKMLQFAYSLIGRLRICERFCVDYSI
ncbi:hypothetical protein D3C72_1559660 [compost metagenome]